MRPVELPAPLMLMIALLLACGQEAAPDPDPSPPPRGVSSVAAPVRRAEPLPLTAEQPPAPPARPRPLAPPQAPEVDAATIAAVPAPAAQTPRPDRLAQAIEVSRTSLEGCMPRTLEAAPSAALRLEISVTGYVTRAEVEASGLDPSIAGCLRRVATGIRFPAGERATSYRYALQLQRATKQP